MRCFVALDLPAPVRNHLANVTETVHDRYDVKWVPRDQLHLSLVFAGEVSDEGVDALVDFVQSVDLPRMQLSLQPFGWFPPRGIPRVLWAGLGGDTAALSELQEELATATESIGIERDKRGFTPHVTIGRVKGPFGALALLDKLKAASKELKPKPFAPSALVLYRSTLTPEGPYYEPIVSRRPD